MRVSSLELKNFRNYSFTSVIFTDGLNVLFGKNASGKTNMLESIFLCSVFHSPRTTKDKELVLWNQDKALVKIEIEKKYNSNKILLQIDSQGKKKVLVDGLPIQRSGELLGVLGVVFFSPDEMKLVKESPIERRRFLDIALSQQQKSYFYSLQRYNKILKQKNNLIKTSAFSQNIDDMLDVWDIGLAKEGAILIKKRLDYLIKLNEYATNFHLKLSLDQEILNLEYECPVLLDDNIEKNLLESLRKSREKDKKLGYCTVGPHRDDIKISINGLDSRKFASQGQQRSIALSMKLAEVELYKDETNESPVLLLDDVLSELDINRQNIFLSLCNNYQTIVTCTEYNLNIKANLINIEEINSMQKNDY